MAGFLDKFRKKVFSSVYKESPPQAKAIDDKIALGVLLWAVADADEKFLPQEEEKIKEIIFSYCKVPKADIPFVLSSIKEADQERIDLYRFTHEVSDGLNYKAKISIIEDLFRVACADGELNDNELEIIRKISGLFELIHSDFIKAKIKIKKEFGLETAEF